MVVYWYTIVSVVIVVTSAVGSIYVLCRRKPKKQTQSSAETATETGTGTSSSAAVVKQTLLYNVSTDTKPYWSQHLWTSCWRGLHPAYLLALRLVSLILLAFFLSWDIHHWGASIFIYYTEWTYSLTMMYFAIGSVISAQGRYDVEQNPRANITKQGLSRREPLLEYYPDDQDSQSLGFLGYLMLISYQISAGAVILTDVIFWFLIVPFVSNARLGLTPLMGCIHTVNIAFLLVDTSINRLPFPWFRLSYFVLWSSAYVIFQWIIHLCGFTEWPYPFLKLSTPLAPLWYLVLAVLHFACYGVYAILVRVKESLFSKLFPHFYIRSN